jgi:hypothetical protein
MKRMLKSLGVTLAALLVALALCEMILWAMKIDNPSFWRPDRRLGVHLRAGVEGWQTREGRAYVRINSKGLRDEERALEKPRDVYRIAVFGDSSVEALQVDLKDTFPTLLGQRLSECRFQAGKRIEVINFGVAGFGTAQEYVMLETEAAAYRPDLVMLAFSYGSDLRNNSRVLETERMRPFFVLEGGRLVLDSSFSESDEFKRRTAPWRTLAWDIAGHSRLLRLLNFLSASMEARAAGEGGVPAGVESGLDDAFLAPPKNQAWQDAWTISEAIILKMDELTSRIGGKLMLVGLTMGIQVHPDPGFRATLEKKLGVGDLFYPNTRLAEFARKHGIRALMPAAEMQRFAETHKAFLHGFKNANNVGGGHWNEAGHRLAAEIIARDLCANPL